MDTSSVQPTDSCSGRKRASKELLYCEYSDSKGPENLIESLIEGKKSRPDMKFSCSSVLTRVKNFLPELEKSQEELNEKSPKEYNLEEIDETKPVIEMDLELFENNTNDDEYDASGSETSSYSVLTNCASHTKEPSVPLVEEINDCKKESEST